MEFEFDLLKSESNKIKHGIDFQEARELWKDPNYITAKINSLDEDRFLLIGEYDNKIWSAIFTFRNKNIRIISVRRARKYEKELYKSSRI